MKKIRIQHRESGEYVSASIDDDGVIRHANGLQANYDVWSYDEPVDWIGGVIAIAVCTFAVFAMAGAITFFAATDERKFMRDCLQTASEQECKSQWIVMQRDK
jgi:hypothetical protein